MVVTSYGRNKNLDDEKNQEKPNNSPSKQNKTHLKIKLLVNKIKLIFLLFLYGATHNYQLKGPNLKKTDKHLNL